MQQAIAEKRTQVGGDWFFWIAGFSAVSSIAGLFGQHFYFAAGLGTTELIDGAINGGISGFITGSLVYNHMVAVALDFLAAAFYVLYGFFARKGARWAFLAGMIFYALDALLLLTFKSWISVAFHAYALFRIFQGFQAAQQLKTLRAQSAAYGAGGYVPPANSSGDVWPPPPSA